jgi:hypothetical protein
VAIWGSRGTMYAEWAVAPHMQGVSVDSSSPQDKDFLAKSFVGYVIPVGCSDRMTICLSNLNPRRQACGSGGQPGTS